MATPHVRMLRHYGNRVFQSAARRRTAQDFLDKNRHLLSTVRFHQSSSSSSTEPTAIPLLATLQDGIWQVPRRGTGFDNFFPKNKRKEGEGKGKEGEETNGEQEGKKDGDGGGRFRFGGGGGDNNNNNNNNPISPQMLAGILLLVFINALMSFNMSKNENPVASRDITWSDLINHLIEGGQVDKIVVIDKGATAKVFLKPGAPGLPDFRKRALRRGMGGIASASATTSQDMMQDHDLVEGISSASGSIPAAASTSSRHPLVYRFAIGSADTFERKLEEAQASLGFIPSQYVPVQYTPDDTVITEMANALGSIFTIALFLMISRFVAGGMGGAAGRGGGAGGGGGMGGIFQFGRSNAKRISKEEVNVTFADVAGCQEAKKEIMEFVDFLQEPERFTKLGAKIPKGALLCGPPGTGKTLLAKAVAGEAGVPFYSISGSDFIEMFVGVGPSRVRDLFKEARGNAPCIVFIDEIDAVGRQRGRGGLGGNDERENTLNQLLVEMDGFNPSTGVVVLAGTNRVDILDQALTRPGRFDRQITVDKPDLQGRKEIFQVHLKGLTLEDEIDDIAGRLAGLTPGFAGADIANICNEAAIVAARRKAETVAMDDFQKATDRIIGGLESNKIMSKEERSIVAHHEAGHAVAGWFLEHADPLLKVTIIPRTSGALGYAQYLPKEVFLRTHDQIMDIVCMALAGRAAEDIFFGRVTTGASDDLRRVTDLVYSTIQLYGMNSRLGQLAFPKDPNAMFDERPYSDATAKAMDEEAKKFVDVAYQRTLDLLTERKTEVEQVAKTLLEKETITHDDVLELIGPRPFVGDAAYEEYIKAKDTRAGKTKQDDGEKEAKDKKEDDVMSGPLDPGLA